MILALAPQGKVVEYDQSHLALYAALLAADDGGQDWREVAVNLMGIDARHPSAKVCWQSHLDRARWIVGDGLASAMEMFGRSSRS